MIGILVTLCIYQILAILANTIQMEDCNPVSVTAGLLASLFLIECAIVTGWSHFSLASRAILLLRSIRN